MKTAIIYCESNHQVPPLMRGEKILKKGSINGEGNYPLPCDIRLLKDVEMHVSDGTKLYADIFLPVTDEKVPAIIQWCPYNKEIHNIPFPWFVSPDRLSGLQRFEGLDPGFWVEKGYAIIHPNARGAGNSEGDIYQWGNGEAKDAYDFIEWTAGQDWCNGKVAMSGSSWLTIIQWYTAALRPPHLAAISPWEGHFDGYADSTFRGGICTAGQARIVFEKMVSGLSRYESVPDMAEKYPLKNNDYWDDKVAKVENIDIPAYIVASYTNSTHTVGTFNAWEKVGTEKKWFRVHNTHEWNDLYSHQPELLKFFDHYLKNIDNDWEETPYVRISVLDPGGEDVIDRVEQEFPLPRTQYEKLYLNAAEDKTFIAVRDFAEKAKNEVHYAYGLAAMALKDAKGYGLDDAKAETESKATYANGSSCAFIHTFEKDTELTGFMKLHLWAQAEDSDDMDVFLHVIKLDKDGNPLVPLVIGATDSGPFGKPFFGPFGGLRLSMRHTDPEKSTDYKPYLTYDRVEKPGQQTPVCADIPLSPMGMKYKAGESVCVIISSIPMDLPPQGAETINNGSFSILTGGSYDSYLQIPVV
ncbi:MAG: CocE/NonD family hydrolase [Lachnospiraceae bacterium]|nr:CocE/NonD family hydrolase [Lachnospiraceae bacterium]